MMSACIMLAFFAAVFSVNNGLLPKCHITCKNPGLFNHLFNTTSFLFKLNAFECSIHTPETSNCILDVSDIIQSFCNQKELMMTHHLTLVCDNTQYRPIITNRQSRHCRHKIGLHVIKCGLLWQDLDAFGEFLPLYNLYLEDYEDQWDQEFMKTDYWKKYLDLRGENETGIMDSEMQLVKIPHGLRGITSLTMVNLDQTPGILQEFIWPWMNELVFNNTPLSSHFTHSHLQTIFPILTNFELRSGLTQPPLLFLSDDHTSVLSRNLSKLEKSLRSKFKGIFYNVTLDDQTSVLPGNLSIIENLPSEFIFYNLSLDGNRITDLSNCTFKGNLGEISLKDNNLENVNTNLFMNMQGVRSIYLNSNKLSSIPARLFQNQHKLVTLSLANNILVKIPARLFQSLRRKKGDY